MQHGGVFRMTVLTYLFVVLATLASLALPVLGVVVVVAWLRRGRHLDGGEASDPLNAAVLDSLDQVHVRLDAVSDRLARLEQSLEAGDRRSLEPPEDPEDDE